MDSAHLARICRISSISCSEEQQISNDPLTVKGLLFFLASFVGLRLLKKVFVFFDANEGRSRFSMLRNPERCPSAAHAVNQTTELFPGLAHAQTFVTHVFLLPTVLYRNFVSFSNGLMSTRIYYCAL